MIFSITPKRVPLHAPHGLGRFTYPMKERLQLNNDWWTSMDSLYNITVTLYLYLMITGPLSFQQGHKYSKRWVKAGLFRGPGPILCKHVWIITDKKGCRNLCSRPQMAIWTKIRPENPHPCFFPHAFKFSFREDRRHKNFSRNTIGIIFAQKRIMYYDIHMIW